MVIKNIDGLKVSQIKHLVNQGAKFVIFPYTISFILMTLRRNSDIYFIKPDEGTFKYSCIYVLINFFVGWWSFPWGPIYTIGAMHKHLIGGVNVTQHALNQLALIDPDGNRTNYTIPTNPNTNNPLDQVPNNVYNVSGNMSANSRNNNS